MSKKRIGMLLALCVVLTLLPFGAMAAGFTDVESGAYYEEAVNWAVSQKPQITNGMDETHFAPNDTCIREQIVTFLWRAMGEQEPSAKKSAFVDVPADAYYFKAVLWAAENEITNGTDAAHFSPKAPCTRAQVVTFLWRALGEPEPYMEESVFDDVQNKNAYYYQPVLWAAEEGVTNGLDATHFAPDATCTRGQIVTFLHRALSPMEPLLSKMTTKRADGTTYGYIFTYDDHGNCIRITDLDGKNWEERTYDEHGNLIGRRDSIVGEIKAASPDASKTDREFDEQGRLIKETIHHEDYDEVSIYAYDTDGRLLTVKDEKGNLKERHTYDKNGNRTKSEWFSKDGFSSVNTYEYNKDGLLIKMFWDQVNPDGKHWKTEVTITYDQDGNCQEERYKHSDGSTEKHVYYYENGVVVKRILTQTEADGTVRETTEETFIAFPRYKLQHWSMWPSLPENF